MKIVITGALGHIGSRLIRELPSFFPEAEIVLIDNLATQRYCSLFHLPERASFRFIEADVVTADLDPILSGADAVIHLAAIADPAESFRKSRLVEAVNVRGTERVARACLRAQSPMLFASTTSLYGKASSPYADSKRKGEAVLQRLRGQGLRFVILRFGTVFGVSPGMRFSTAVNKFCWQAALRQPVTVWRAALNQKRPYLDLGDAVGSIGFAMKRGLFDGTLYDVVTTNTDVAAVLEILRNLSPRICVECVEANGMDPSSYEVSSRRLLSKGFRFQGDLRSGMAEIVRLLQSASPQNPLSFPPSVVAEGKLQRESEAETDPRLREDDSCEMGPKHPS
ncbi:MAG: SDR family oxidoreductase [Candidatus Omnitrophica bacterium]|nr:SDR family oxidoreductase [Candidatus Omnitrophota bacterium]